MCPSSFETLLTKDLITGYIYRNEDLNNMGY